MKSHSFKNIGKCSIYLIFFYSWLQYLPGINLPQSSSYRCEAVRIHAIHNHHVHIQGLRWLPLGHLYSTCTTVYIYDGLIRPNPSPCRVFLPNPGHNARLISLSHIPPSPPLCINAASSDSAFYAPISGAETVLQCSARLTFPPTQVK